MASVSIQVEAGTRKDNCPLCMKDLPSRTLALRITFSGYRSAKTVRICENCINALSNTIANMRQNKL